MGDPSRGPPGLICTFYSYKGGVGRTMALANVGVLLAGWGYRVLCIDWDIEAPGLHRYFAPLLRDEPGDGLLELVEHLAGGSDVDWTDFAVAADVPGARGHLDFIPAGRFDETYVERLQALNWEQLYDERDLGLTIESLRDAWVDAYDVVLIDSRTGITDAGGICTVQLPDVLVVALTANHQNLDGALEILRRAEQQRDRLPVDRDRLRALPLVTRFESQTEVELAREWTLLFETALTPIVRVWCHRDTDAGDVLGHLRVPSVPHWSFGERLPVLDEGTSDPFSIGYALETAAAILAHGLERTELLITNRQSFVDAARSRGIALGAGGERGLLDAFIACHPRDAELADRITEGLRRRGLEIRSSMEESDPTDILRARCLVVLIGPHGPVDESEYQSFLLLAAIDDSPRPVIPVLLGQASGGLTPSLRSFKAISVDPAADDVTDTLAVPLLQHRLDAFRRRLGATDADTLLTAEQTADALAQIGEPGPAIELLRDVVQARSSTLGADHPDTLTSIARLADMLAADGQTDDARVLYSRVLDGRRRALGEDHPETLAARHAAELATQPAVRSGLSSRRQFINRITEQEQFAMLLRSTSDHSLLLVRATGGEGKTALLRVFREQCISETPPVPCALVSSAEVPLQTPLEFARAIAHQLARSGLPLPTFDERESARLSGDDPVIAERAEAEAVEGFLGDLEAALRQGQMIVLMVDDYEHLTMDVRSWLEHVLLRRLMPSRLRVVIAGREVPAVESLPEHAPMVISGLSPLSTEDIREFLALHGFEAQTDEEVAFLADRGKSLTFLTRFASVLTDSERD